MRSAYGLRLGAYGVVVALAAGCVRPHVEDHVRSVTLSAPCRALVDAAGQVSDERVTWARVASDHEQQTLARWCDAVGPALHVAAAPARNDQPTALDGIAIVSWNAHVGGGDLAAFVGRLRSGDLSGGRPVHDFILLLQETFRSGSAVPRDIRFSDAAPRAIAETPPGGVRKDIAASARALGLSVFYAPSMRNGVDVQGVAEDRGNAILSTLPLSDFSAIELPFERQRRVAIAASIAGIDTDGRAWHLRVVSAHLDASAGARRLWLFASGWRAQQAAFLTSVLAGQSPVIIGSDLNTWSEGMGEPAYRTLRDAFPQTAPPPLRATFKTGLMLDYVFFRLPSSWMGESTPIGSRFGSDHHPLLAWIRPAGAPSPAIAARTDVSE